MPDFNKEQQAAISARNPFLLCSAGAGSGKTTVMVESIIRKLAENPDKDIAGFLVITFTNEAAANMKRKIRQRLAEEAGKGEAYAARGLNNLENASVCTIHSFCKTLISSYFYAIEGMSPKFDILEEAKLERLFQEAYETALDDICAKGQTVCTPQEAKLVRELMVSFNQADILAMARNLYNALMGIPDPFDHLDRYVEGISAPSEENVWAQEILFAADMDLAGLEDFILQEQGMLCALTPPKCEEAAEADAEIIRSLLAALKGDLTIQEKIDAVTAARSAMPNVVVRKADPAVKEWYEDFRKLRAGVKGAGGVLDKTAKNLQLLLEESQLRDNLKIQRLLRGMAVLLRAAADRFRRLKLEESGIDYADMEQMACELVRREDIREAVTETITDIYVDECQDVSAIQYAIIGALTGGENRSILRVGDIKQSIYGFRSAAPDLMERDIRAYSADPDAPCRKIFFQQNYRSCRQVIECINEVFETSMEKSISEINYTPEDHLKANVDGDFGPVEVILLAQDALADGAPEAGAEAEAGAAAPEGLAAGVSGPEKPAGAAPQAPQDMLEAQCEAAGRQIEALISSDDREYRDIVILVQNARTDAPVMVEHFRRMHIPVLYDGGLTFYGLTEISSFLALLSVIDNDHTDVELVGALRNVPFRFSDADLAMIREAKPGHAWFYEAFRACCDRGETELDLRCRKARDQIRAWREQARITGVSEFIWRLMRESGIYAVRGAYPDGKLRQMNLDSLYQRSVDMEGRGILRLSDFLREIGKLRESKSGDTGDTPAAMGESDNFVRLMTMHKSKGLEFPVVILMNLQKNLRVSPGRSKMKINVGTEDTASAPLGVYVPAVSLKKHTKRDTFGLEAFRIRNIRSSIAEDTRLLYVAMTRAMQKLILIGHYKEKETGLWTEKAKVSRIWKTRSMLDLIMPAVLSHVELPAPGKDARGGQWHLSVQIPSAIREADGCMPQGALDKAIADLLAGEPAPQETLWKETRADTAPLKTSVTSLLRSGVTISLEAYAPPEEEETVETKRRSELPGFLLGETPPRPAFMEETRATAADIGSLTHRFLRLIDLAPFRDSADGGAAADCLQKTEAELLRMRDASILTEAEAKAVYLKGAADFLASDLGKRLAAAKVLHREWPFTMQIRADSPTMVQGIVDAAFLEDGQWVLVDYKTDRDTRPEVFIPRHERQMNWYRTALERLTGIPVREMWLFALRSGKSWPVERMAV